MAFNENNRFVPFLEELQNSYRTTLDEAVDAVKKLTSLSITIVLCCIAIGIACMDLHYLFFAIVSVGFNIWLIRKGLMQAVNESQIKDFIVGDEFRYKEVNVELVMTVTRNVEVARGRIRMVRQFIPWLEGFYFLSIALCTIINIIFF